MLLATNGYDTTTRSTCLVQASATSSTNTYWQTNTTASSRGICSRGSWLIEYVTNNSKILWTLSDPTNTIESVYIVHFSAGRGPITVNTVKTARAVLPSLYLKSNVTCTNCDDSTAGTSTNPWTLSM